MTNKDKFVEVFRAEPDINFCPIISPCSDCFCSKQGCNEENTSTIRFWDYEYVEGRSEDI